MGKGAWNTVKICLVCPYTAPAKDSQGAERMIESLAKGFLQLGHEVVMNINSDSNWPFCPVVEKIPDDCDIINFNGWEPNTSEAEYNSYGIPWVVTMHGGGMETEQKWLETVTANPHIICVSKFISDRLQCPAYAWSCSNPEDFTYREEKEDYFLWMAGTDWGEGKGLWTTIRIAKNMGFKLKIAGTGKNVRNIEHIKSLCNDKIEYIGSINGQKKAEVLSKAKGLFLLTQLPDACPLTVSEAMLSGTPIIASDKGCMPEVIMDKVTGFVCKNDTDIARAVMKLKIGRKSLYSKMCRQVGEEKFSHVVGAKEYLRFYQNMINLGKVA